MLKDLLPYLKSSWEKRKHRPLPESVEFTRSKFDKIWIVDSSVLEALFKKLKSLEKITQGQLAGKIGVVIDLVTRLPVEIWVTAHRNRAVLLRIGSRAIANN